VVAEQNKMNVAVAVVFLAFCGNSWSILVDDVREDVIQQIDGAWAELKVQQYRNCHIQISCFTKMASVSEEDIPSSK
jgi:hypothetical protein